MRLVMLLAALALSAALAHAAVTTTAPATVPAVVAKAVTTLRNLDPTNWSDVQREAKALEVEKACGIIVDAGPNGAAAVKQELASLAAARKKDDRFCLAAGALLWEIGKLDEADAIAGIWRSTPLEAQPNYVFFTACAAAQTHDARAEPMLRAFLKDDKLRVFIPAHSMVLAWPLTQQFVWGIYGSRGLPALTKAIAESKDAAEIGGAVQVLSRAQYLPAVAQLRILASSNDPQIASWAAYGLGSFGCAEDFDLLVAGSKVADPKIAFRYACALYEYGDLRAVPALATLAASTDPQLRGESFAGLLHLLTPASLEVATRQSQRSSDPAERDGGDAREIEAIYKAMRVSGEQYAAKTPAEREKLVATLRGQRESRFRLTPADRVMTHDELVEGVKEWTAKHTIRGGKYAWAEDRHIVSAATPADLDLLFDLRAAVLTRLSDECLYETKLIEGVMERIGRTRYREVVGVTTQVKPTTQPGHGP